MPTINLPDDELAAVTAAIRGVIESDRFPHAPRLDPLRAALARFEAAAEPTPQPKAPPPAKDKRRCSRSERDHRHSVGARGRVQGGAEVGIAFGGRHGSVHQAEDHRRDGGGADGDGVERAGPRLKAARIIAALAAHGHPVAEYEN
jgi:hypothetical protein